MQKKQRNKFKRGLKNIQQRLLNQHNNCIEVFVAQGNCFQKKTKQNTRKGTKKIAKKNAFKKARPVKNLCNKKQTRNKKSVPK